MILKKFVLNGNVLYCVLNAASYIVTMSMILTKFGYTLKNSHNDLASIGLVKMHRCILMSNLKNIEMYTGLGFRSTFVQAILEPRVLSRRQHFAIVSQVWVISAWNWIILGTCSNSGPKLIWYLILISGDTLNRLFWKYDFVIKLIANWCLAPVVHFPRTQKYIRYRQVSNISRTLVGN